MRVYTLWHQAEDNEAPWFVAAVDEYTVDNNCQFPKDYLQSKADPQVRELILDVPENAVRALFEAPTVRATVVK